MSVVEHDSVFSRDVLTKIDISFQYYQRHIQEYSNLIGKFLKIIHDISSTFLFNSITCIHYTMK